MLALSVALSVDLGWRVRGWLAETKLYCYFYGGSGGGLYNHIPGAAAVQPCVETVSAGGAHSYLAVVSQSAHAAAPPRSVLLIPMLCGPVNAPHAHCVYLRLHETASQTTQLYPQSTTVCQI